MRSASRWLPVHVWHRPAIHMRKTGGACNVVQADCTDNSVSAFNIIAGKRVLDAAMIKKAVDFRRIDESADYPQAVLVLHPSNVEAVDLGASIEERTLHALSTFCDEHCIERVLVSLDGSYVAFVHSSTSGWAIITPESSGTSAQRLPLLNGTMWRQSCEQVL